MKAVTLLGGPAQDKVVLVQKLALFIRVCYTRDGKISALSGKDDKPREWDDIYVYERKEGTSNYFYCDVYTGSSTIQPGDGFTRDPKQWQKWVMYEVNRRNLNSI